MKNTIVNSNEFVQNRRTASRLDGGRGRPPVLKSLPRALDSLGTNVLIAEAGDLNLVLHESEGRLQRLRKWVQDIEKNCSAFLMRN